MQEIKLRFDLTFSRRFICGAMTVAMVLAGAPELDSENVTLSTYYPAPSGVYTRMITTNDTFLARDAGNVGIGVATPGSKLDVAGNILLSAPGPTITMNVGGPTMSVPAANVLVFGTSGIERVRINNLGNVGIGTAVPGQKLEVAGNTLTSYLTTPTASGAACISTPYAISGFTLCPGGTYTTVTSGVIAKYTVMPDYERGDGGATGLGHMFCCTCPAGGCPLL